VNVLFELETVREDICMQLLKLSEETWIVPEQEVFEVFIVIVELSITSEKVIDMFVSIATGFVESAGVEEETVGAVMSSLKA